MSGSGNERHCVFCGNKTTDKTIKFTEGTLKKCLEVMAYRKTKLSKRKSRSNHKNVELSSESSLDDIYHAQCYKLYTAVKIPPDFYSISERESTTAEIDDTPSELLIPNYAAAMGISEIQGEMSGSSASTCIAVAQNDPELTHATEEQEKKDEEVHNRDSNDFIEIEEYGHEKNVNIRTCFICARARKRSKGREIPIAVNRKKTVDFLKRAATEHNDVEMLEKLSLHDADSEIYYHKCCKDQYLRAISKEEDSNFVKRRRATNTAYGLLCDILEEYVVQNKECLFYDHVKSEYLRLITEQFKLSSDSIHITSFLDRHLERKLMETFNNRIKIIYAEKKKFLVPLSANLVNYKDLFRYMTLKESVRSVALKLREEALNCAKTKLPDESTAKDSIRGECDNVPELLTCFLETFILGDVTHLSRKSRDKRKENDDLKLFSLGQDLLYAACNKTN